MTRVLIVDDNPMFTEMAEFVLRAAQYETATAADAEEALSEIPRFNPELVLLDVQMPGMDGIALTRQLKADPETQGIVLVAFTAFASKGDEIKLKAAGFDGYIAKPVEVMTLAAQVRFWLEGPSTAKNSGFLWP